MRTLIVVFGVFIFLCWLVLAHWSILLAVIAGIVVYWVVRQPTARKRK